MQSILYPKGPANVPPEITNPSKSFKKHIWIASAVLILFMGIYMGLSTWFLYKSYKLFANAFSGGRDSGFSAIGALLLGFLGIFMIKALFFRTKKDNRDTIEIKKEEEPELFNFVNKIADDANAPRPHKIFLSNVVNASVFYDISVINLIFPTKKNLEIGLGLVNTLNLGEFKSIIAHEFGHFAQKSMLIGRWVYVAHRVAQQIVGKRDAFDTFLSGLSGLDLRIAWIGWLLSIIVWSIRSISDTLFTLVLITQRALSREMEFHADLVSVSLTGSDAIVNSLYKLQAADEAYDKAIEFVNKQLENKKAVSDIYAIQSNSIKHMAVVLNNPDYGASPKPEGFNGNGFRVFKEQIAQAPKMWSTHPSNIDREKNAKTIYIPSEIDERSPWLLFKDPDTTKNKTTLILYKNLKIQTSPLSKAESIALHDLEFQRSFLLPKYRGIYLDRPILLNYREVEEIYTLQIGNDQLNHQFTLLYPESLQQQLMTLKNLEEEIEMLEGLNNKTLDANQKKINYRNTEINRKDLPEAIEKAKKEAKIEQDKIEEHNRLCRNVHYAASKKVGKGWDTYLVSVTKVVHYCDHSKKNIESLTKYFYKTLAVASRIKNINADEIAPLLNAANNLYQAIESVFTKAVEIKLSQPILDKMGGKRLEEFLEPLQLGTPNNGNINSWIAVVDGWTELALKGLNIVHEAALDELLLTEEYIKESYISAPENVKEAPEQIFVYNGYTRYNPDLNHEVTQKPDLFSRFYNGDGIFHAIGRLAVAASIIFCAIFFTVNIGDTKIIIYNGLPIDVVTHLENKDLMIPHDQSSEIVIENTSSIEINTTTVSGESIETFTAKLPNDSRTYIYNIANATIIYTWTAYYGNNYYGNLNNNFSIIGNQRWMEMEADYYFEEPPESVTVSAGTTESKKILSAYSGHPNQLANAIISDEYRASFLKIHAKYEKSNSPYILSWLTLASSLPEFPEILKNRLAINPKEIVSLRMQQDFYIGEEKKKICDKHHQIYLSQPENPDLYYLDCRCIENEDIKDSAFIAGHNKWKDNTWLSFAAGNTFIQMEKWSEAVSCLALVSEKAPELKEVVLEELKRISHFTDQDSLTSSIIDLQLPYLVYVQNAENSTENSNAENSDNYTYAYKLLAQGKIKEAIEYSKPDSGLYYMIIRLAAVSDSTNEDIIKQALALDTLQGLNNTTFIPALALMVRNNLPFENNKETYKVILGDAADTLFTFIKLIKTNKIAEADNIIKPMSAEMKGKLSLLGLLLAGEKAPYKWNRYASGLLFITEKPYRLGELKSLKTKNISLH